MKHARLSASSAHRWFVCPGSIKLSEGLPPKSSMAAAQGTLAHDVAAQCLKHPKQFKPQDFLSAAYRNHIVDGYDLEVDKEMVDNVAFYVKVVQDDVQAGDETWCEMPLLEALQKIDPDFGGTADSVRYRPRDGTLRVFDFKYGSGLYVDVDANKQMMFYGLGVMLQCGRPVTRVPLTIVQPRYVGASPVRDWTFAAYEITDFIADAKEAAIRTREPNPALVPGEHCTFCPAAGICPALEKQHHALVAAEFADLPSIPAAKLSEALTAIPLVKERIRAIEEFAYTAAQQGIDIPGFKLVDKRAVRRWKDETKVIGWAKQRAVDPFGVPEVLSPAQLEKKLDKVSKKELAELYESKSSGTVLVPVTDDRLPAKRITADSFAAIETTVDKKEVFPVSVF